MNIPVARSLFLVVVLGCMLFTVFSSTRRRIYRPNDLRDGALIAIARKACGANLAWVECTC